MSTFTTADPPAVVLGRYSRRDGAAREVVSIARADGIRLVIDRISGLGADARLVGEIALEEPPENARILCDVYLADEGRGTCRALSPGELSLPVGLSGAQPRPRADALETEELNDAAGRRYAIREVTQPGSCKQVRWTRVSDGLLEPVTLREVIAAMEDYEPARALTETTLAFYENKPGVALFQLRGDLARVLQGPLVLNRRLREVVGRRVAAGELSMSEIALRCGREQRGGGGETSWLARRIGQAPCGGGGEPTPWVHTDVLALIAREGLGVNPSEVEVSLAGAGGSCGSTPSR